MTFFRSNITSKNTLRPRLICLIYNNGCNVLDGRGNCNRLSISHVDWINGKRGIQSGRNTHWLLNKLLNETMGNSSNLYNGRHPRLSRHSKCVICIEVVSRIRRLDAWKQDDKGKMHLWNWQVGLNSRLKGQGKRRRKALDKWYKWSDWYKWYLYYFLGFKESSCCRLSNGCNPIASVIC